MKENNDGFEHRKLIEITPDRAGPKKSGRIFRAVAGTAAAVAVVGGSVWGINYLKENGGLKQKEPETSTGAGYHETAENVGYRDFVIPEKQSVQENVFDLGDLKVTVNWWKFDGTELIMQYDVEFDGEPFVRYGEDEPWHRIILKIEGDDPTDIDDDETVQLDNGGCEVIKLLRTLKYADPTDHLTIKFSDWEFGWARQEGDIPFDSQPAPDSYKGLHIDLTRGRNTAVRYIDSDDDVLGAHIGKAYITDGEISFDLSDISDEMLLGTVKLRITGADGKENVLCNRMFTLDPNGKSCVISFSTDGAEYDMADISSFGFAAADAAGEGSYEGTGSYEGSAGNGIYIGEEALNVLKIYAVGYEDKDYSYPLEKYDADRIQYRTYDKLRGKETGDGEYRFNFSADEGAPVFSVTDGVVIGTYSNWLEGHGNGINIIVQSPDGRKWRYSHLSDFYVSEGDAVKSGDRIAAVGRTGWCTGPVLAIDFPDSAVLDPEYLDPDLKQIAGIYADGELPYETADSELSGETTGTEVTYEMPEGIRNGNGFYGGEYLSDPVTGEDAWELIKQRGDTDIEYDIPYDIGQLTFYGACFYISSADCDYKALAGGTVEYAGWYNGYGIAVIIRADNGRCWLYGHIADGTLGVQTGDTVSAGDVLGHTGTTGMTNGKHYCLRVG